MSTLGKAHMCSSCWDCPAQILDTSWKNGLHHWFQKAKGLQQTYTTSSGPPFEIFQAVLGSRAVYIHVHIVLMSMFASWVLCFMFALQG